MTEPPDHSRSNSDTWAERDAGGALRHLRHLAVPVTYDRNWSDQEVALAYLARPDGYGLSEAQLALLGRRREAPGTPPPGEGEWYRWLPTRHLPARPGGTARASAVLLQQTCAFLADGRIEEMDVEGAGLRVVIRRRPAAGGAEKNAPPAEVVSSNATIVPGPREVRSMMEAVTPLSAPGLQSILPGMLPGSPEGGMPVAVVRARPVLRHAAPPPGIAGVRPEPGVSGASRTLAWRLNLLADPTDPLRLTMGGLAADAQLGLAPASSAGKTGFHVLIEFDGAAPRVSSVRTLAACCRGTCFPRDPASITGSLALRADLPAAMLDPLRSDLPLEGLNPVAPQQLSGRLVRLADPNPLGIPPPQQPAPQPFAASSRSDGFAAVSAYRHCHAMFSLARSFGFDETNYFFPHGQPLPEGVPPQFPVTVIHRAAMTLPQPSTASAPFTDAQVFTVNAQVLAGAGEAGGLDLSTLVTEMRFAAGDLTAGRTVPGFGAAPEQGTLGVAADPRWCWHEFGHVLLVAGTGSLELPFAHSVGDALAAIMCDPESELARPAHGDMRGITFPWVWEPLRRHDRSPRLGWGWHGTLYPPAYPDALDPDGYVAEEILSSTLFRLYRALGGDALLGSAAPGEDEPDRPRRRAAADYVTYLIMRAIGTLGPAATIPSTPGVFAGALMCADAETGLFTHGGQQRQGGAVRKVIRWAFERQGLYHDPALPYPHNGPGLPEPVDVFLEDGRGGQYWHRPEWQARPEALWVRPAGLAGVGDVGPSAGQPYDLWVRVRNRGTAPAGEVTVTVHAAEGMDVDTWHPATWAQLSGPGGTEAIPPGGFADFGPFTCTPAGPGRHAVLARVEAPGDRSVLYPPSGLACAAGPTPITALVPFDNNLGYRCWSLS